jgi:serine-type D-Ala-D-Ala carboxypeptidase/endopeptidase
MRLILFAVALALGTFSAARAADDPVLTEAADLPGFFMFHDSGAPGMVLVVERGGATLMRFYGETEKGNHRSPDGTSLLRLNSITKVFTTEMVAWLAAEGKLALTDPLRRFAGDVRVPRYGERPITLLDLATHSAVLPRELGDLPEGANPRAWPTIQDRWKWLAGYMLPWAPGTIAAYSNVGFDLLADAAAQAGGQS